MKRIYAFAIGLALLVAPVVTTAIASADPGARPMDYQQITDVVRCPSGHIVVFDSTLGAPGLRVYRGTAETTGAVLPIGNAKQGLPQHGLVCY